MTNEQQPSAEDWCDFSSQFLKVDLIKEFPVTLICKDVETEYDDDKPKLYVITEYLKKPWKMGINKTNITFIRNLGIKSPKAIIGKKLTFDKIKVRNPLTNSMVDGFLLTKVE
jgi:hypothetical protein